MDLDPVDQKQQEAIDRLALENRAQQDELETQAAKDKEQDHRLERMAVLVDRVERTVFGLALWSVVLFLLFIILRHNSIEINVKPKVEAAP